MDHGGDAWRERAIRDAVLAGDDGAWRAWYDEHFCRLASYIRWRCGGRDDLAEDVLQETWLVAVKRLKTFDPQQGPFAAWVSGIAANVIRTALRKGQRDKLKPLESEPASPGAGPDAEPVAEALAALEPHYEAVLRAKYLEQRSVAEIAEQMNESPKAIESRLTRARQAFREFYEAHRD